MHFTLDHLHQVLSAWPRPSRYRVALSGGLDSTVLLHALAGLQDRLGVPLAAVHADHGLQAASGDWARHCARLCADLAIPLETLELTLTPQRGESTEALARQARYAAFAQTMRDDEVLLVAQHQDDQAETVLLQLLRGAGVAGLAAMPARKIFGTGVLGRPLLAFNRTALESYAQQHGLRWVEDPSNLSRDFDRNYLRHEVMPRLKSRWPATAATLSRSAGHCADAERALQFFAAQDLSLCRLTAYRLLSLPLVQLPVERQANLLRAWITGAGLPIPPTQALAQVLEQLIPARQDATPLVCWAGAELRRYRDELWLMPPLSRPPRGWQQDWSGEVPLMLPADLGSLMSVPGAGGIDPARFHGGHKQVAFRREGLSCQPAGRQGHRSLKKLFQDLDVPPWLRERVPLLFIDGELAAIGDYVVSSDFATTGPGIQLHWQRPAWLEHVEPDADDEEE